MKKIFAFLLLLASIATASPPTNPSSNFYTITGSNGTANAQLSATGTGGSATVYVNGIPLSTGSSAVNSVNTLTGAVVLTATNQVGGETAQWINGLLQISGTPSLSGSSLSSAFATISGSSIFSGSLVPGTDLYFPQLTGSTRVAVDTSGTYFQTGSSPLWPPSYPVISFGGGYQSGTTPAGNIPPYQGNNAGSGVPYTNIEGGLSISGGALSSAANGYLAVGQSAEAAQQSIALGNQTQTGLLCVAIGHDSQAISTESVAIGRSAAVYGGTNSYAFGYFDNQQSGFGMLLGSQSTSGTFRYGYTLGQGNTSNGYGAVAVGNYVTAQSYDSLVVGQYNVIQGNQNSFVSTDDLFVVGNGTGTSSPNDALELLKNGNMTLNGTGLFPLGITSLPSPVNPSDAATKNYVDNAVNGLDWKPATAWATTSALPSNTYNNGASGVGATLTAVLSGTLIVDSGTPALNDTILVKNEVAGANDGIYSVTTLGNVSTPYVLTRANYFNSSSNIMAGDTTFIYNGTTNYGTSWTMTTSGSITVGTTSLVFTQVAGPGYYSGGNNIVISGNLISLANNVSISGTFSGNGSLLTNLHGANVTGTVANATTAVTITGTIPYTQVSGTFPVGQLGISSGSDVYISPSGAVNVINGPIFYSSTSGVITIDASGTGRNVSADLSFGTTGVGHIPHGLTVLGGTAQNGAILSFGAGSIASATNSVAIGLQTTASGTLSHATGSNTTSQGYGQFVIGQFNIIQGNGGTYTGTDNAFIIGNGTSSGSPSNAFSITQNGNMTLQGTANISALNLSGSGVHFPGAAAGMYVSNVCVPMLSNTSTLFLTGLVNTSAQSLIPSGTGPVGTLPVIAANALQPGTVIRYHISGVYNMAKITGTATWAQTIANGSGTQTLSTMTNVPGVNDTQTNYGFVEDGDFTCFSSGTAGTLMGDSTITLINPSLGSNAFVVKSSGTNPITYDTTQSGTFGSTWQWLSSGTQQLTVTKFYMLGVQQ
jgi:hypothetical protein